MADEKVKAEAVETEKATSENEDVKAKEEKKDEVKEPTIKELQAEIAQLKAIAEKSKQTISAANTDAAEWKRKYRATLDEAERAQQEQADKYVEMQAELLAYKEKERIATYTTKLVDAGYDTETAKSMAESLTDGLPDTFFEMHKAFLKSKEQQVKTSMLNSQPGLSAGTPPTNSKDGKASEDDDLRKYFGLTK